MATGEVELKNVVPRDASKHRIIVQASGRLTLEGRNRAFLVARDGIRMHEKSTVLGGLILSEYGPLDTLEGRVDWDPETRKGDQFQEFSVEIDAVLDPN